MDQSRQIDLDAAIKAARRIFELDERATKGPWLARDRDGQLRYTLKLNYEGFRK